MAIDELRRTNISALWRYMPGQPYNWASKATVVGEDPRQVSTLDVPEAWVAPQLRRLILPFAAAASGIPGSGPELEIIDRHQFTLVKAEDLRASRFPNTFLCRACSRFRTVRSGQPAPTCATAAHGAMEQFPWAEVHECGHLAELRPPACGNNCRAPMELQNTRDLSIARWYWKCTRCKTRSDRPVANWCTGCRSGRVQLTRLPQTLAYYPQQITVINPPTRSTYNTTLAHDQVHPAAVAQAMGVLPPGLDGLRAAGGNGTDAVAEVQRLAAILGWTTGDPAYQAAMADAHKKAGSAPAWREKVDDLNLTPEALDVLGEECRQLSLAQDAASLNAEDLQETSKGTPLEPQYAGYRSLFARYGLMDVTLLRQLPVAYIVAGYSRVAPKAETTNRRGATVNAKFRFFNGGRDGKFRMYGVRTETEGLLFRLDPLAVVRWLVDSGRVADPEVTTSTEAQQWLFKVTDPITDLFKPPDNKISEALLGLVHSFAHRAMKALAARCGLNVDSLAEFLFPSNCSFLIYANTRSEFILGGIEHVFRYDLADALTELDAESRCVFDPPCRHHFGGACAACLYVSEVACMRFNTVLNRNLLFGSVPPAAGAPTGDQEVTWRPFWML
ncbi:hypothetical protein AB0F43_30940 [Kribbella sp. NPDC023972]|uniref:hypothetical protein n=1 Tax=Kribbella sp. NPDC023972 TaxID=3154795 RepID=UPI0033D9AB41